MNTQEPARRNAVRQQLSKGMEHIRYAVTIDPIPRPASDISSNENDAYGVPASHNPVRKPQSSRSHDPSNNLKRSDPFQFGSRFLELGDDVFQFNAWDHVETDDTYKEFSELQYAKQKEAPVSEFDKHRFNSDPAKWWNRFYTNNTSNFFKNRKWLQQEFPILHQITQPESPPTLLLEVGAGAGNTAFPILAQNRNPHLKIHACDFSKKAIELIRANEAYDERYIRADVWDVATIGSDSLPPGIDEGSVDVVMMIFIFSALAPDQWTQVVRNIWRVLKPGGQVLFRDYGKGDLAQVRFKKGRYMAENFYVRGDGTRVYFFEKQELEEIWGGPASNPELEEDTKLEEHKAEVAEVTQGVKALELDHSISKDMGFARSNTPAFEIIDIGIDRRMLVNRQRKLKMYRCWVQAMFRKPGSVPSLRKSSAS